jgi:hypothetical protein
VSVESLAVALHHSRAKGAAKLVLIGIANHDGDGGAWPSVATLAKYAAVTPRNVQKAVADLERLGEVRRMVGQGGTHLTADHMRPNLYQFILRCPTTCDRSGQHRERGATLLVDLPDPLSQATPPVAGDGGAPVAGDTRTIPEPSITQEKEQKSSTREAAGARYASVVAMKCKATGRPHRFDPSSGYCSTCGLRNDHVLGLVVNTATGEVQ